MAIIGLVALLALAGTRSSAQTAPNGAIAGLTPHFLNVAGIRTRYYRVGQGDPLVLLHGGRCGGVSNSANVWSKNIRPLSRRFQVLAPDRPGHGMTEGTIADCDNNAYQVNWLYHFLNELKLKQVNLVGHSAGGAVAFFFAVAHPEMVKTLVIVAAGPETPGTVPQRMEMAIRLKSCPKTSSSFVNWKCRASALSYAPKIAFDNTFFDTEYSMFLWRRKQGPAYNTKLKVVRRAYAKPSARSLAYRKNAWDKARDGVLGEMPVMLFYGKQDPLDWYASEPTAQLHGAMALFDILGAKDPNVSLTVLNDAGHFVYRVHPRQFDSDLVRFVDYWEHEQGSGAK
jgi:pimeloyl-ACP methyl ester carboxylesterase